MDQPGDSKNIVSGCPALRERGWTACDCAQLQCGGGGDDGSAAPQERSALFEHADSHAVSRHRGIHWPRLR
eukprot:7064618-Pyramimonas_sp.AAC.1